MSEIQALTNRIRDFNQSLDWWNAAMLCSLIVAAVAAIAVVATTRMVLLRAKQVADVQDELIKAKDAQLALDLKDKDLKIAQAVGNASEADERASKNEKEAARLNKLAEDERAARVSVEAKVAWRRLTEEQQQEIGSKLAKFSNQGVSFWFATGDTEAWTFAGDIANAVLRSKTLLVQPPASILMMRESGKFGDPVRSADTGVVVQSTSHDVSRKLADAIVTELTSRGFEAYRQTDPPFDSNPKPQVWVNVWARPSGPQGEYKLTPPTAAK